MFRPFVLIFLAVLGDTASGQNLVPNPSFEDYTQCPSDLGQIDRAVGWESIQISPDLFNTCSTGDTVGVPGSFLGFQPAYEGSGYLGLGTGTLFTKEYAQAELSSALVPGQPAFISMQVSPGGFGFVGTTSPQLASSGIGIRLSVEPLTYATSYGQYDFNTAVAYVSEVLDDTSVWRNVSGMFIPDSAYQYVQIGNFFSDSLTATAVINPDGDIQTAYAFVDQVCVSQVQGVCEVIDLVLENGLVGVPPTVGIGNGLLSVASPRGSAIGFDVRVTDAVGRGCTPLLRVTAGGLLEVATRHWATGVYLVMYRSSTGLGGSVRIVHVQP